MSSPALEGVFGTTECEVSHNTARGREYRCWARDVVYGLESRMTDWEVAICDM